MDKVIIDRWVDLESDEAKKIKHIVQIKQVIDLGINYGAIKLNKDGYLYMEDGITPVNATLEGKVVGLRLVTKASN